MKFPCLVDKRFCKTDIKITINSENISEDGEPVKAFEGSFKCNYQDSAKTIFTTDKGTVQITGIAYIPDDIAPNLPTLSGGTAVVHGVKRIIHSGTKARNPDGTVNYCKLELI